MLRLLKSATDIFETVGKFIYDFFNPKLEGYTNFEFSEGILSLQIIIFGIFAGVLLASFSMIFIKTTLGKLVRAILEKKAFTAEQGVTLAECGLEKHFFVRRALTHGYTLRRVVRCVEEEEFLAKARAEREEYEQARAAAKASGTRLPAYKEPIFKPDLSACHFYIPEKDRYTAEMRFRSSGSGYPTFFFVLLVSILCVILIFALLPHLLRFLDNVVSLFSWKGNLAR